MTQHTVKMVGGYNVTGIEAVRLRSGRWAVRPTGRCGTCGFAPAPWTVVYVKARNEGDAIVRAFRKTGGEGPWDRKNPYDTAAD